MTAALRLLSAPARATAAPAAAVRAMNEPAATRQQAHQQKHHTSTDTTGDNP